ncbi:hypothetical protein C942_04669 [Photobacterium marinum]|uniref:Uncharacterized protein n=2 Tax=Photobacterium marinum TaxID=1056511 RepID=L8JDR7_9GAMM|nr:hypothetical protein C942_04669 [Photobacterium marinum]
MSEVQFIEKQLRLTLMNHNRVHQKALALERRHAELEGLRNKVEKEILKNEIAKLKQPKVKPWKECFKEAIANSVVRIIISIFVVGILAYQMPAEERMDLVTVQVAKIFELAESNGLSTDKERGQK